MKKLLIICLLLTATTSYAGIFDITGEDKIERDNDKLFGESVRQIGMPSIVNFRERRVAKEMLERRDQAITTYAYLYNSMKGCLVYLGQAIGYGVPYATQFVNPEKVYTSANGNTTMPQAEPNGLYMPRDAWASWVMLLNPETKKVEPIYVEPDMLVSPFRLTKQECSSNN